MTLAQDERAALCDLFEQVGPDAPTLCEGWQTRDLAAHLIIRERRPDAAVGILIPAAASYTKSVMDKVAQQPWADLIDQVRSGPPMLSPFSIPGVDANANGIEYFVHHEDVRRAQDGWSPRPADETRYAQLSKALGRMGRTFFRKSAVNVRLQLADGKYRDVVGDGGGVVLTGTPDELVLYGFGRGLHTAVEITGDAADIKKFADLKLGL